MTLRNTLMRALTRNPKCAYCDQDGPWRVAGQQVCDEHKQDVRDMGFTSEPRRC